MLLHTVHQCMRDRVFPLPHRGKWAGRNNVQAGPLCEEDPALPGFVTLTKPPKNPPWRIFR